jgi:hypothetical protein
MKIGKTSTLNLTDSFQNIIDENNDTIEVVTLLISNISIEDVIVDVVITRDSVDYSIIKNGSIPANKSLSVFLSKDFGLYLEPGDILRLKADDFFKADATCSYNIINSIYESSSSSSSFNSGSSSSSSSSLVQTVSSSSSSSVVPRVLYFNGAVNNDWSELGNWWVDEQHTVPATSLPSSIDSVIATASITASGQTVANFTLLRTQTFIFFSGMMTVTGMATFNGTRVVVPGTNDAVNWSVNYGTINGNATFNNSANAFLSSYGFGTINGNATFNNSINTSTITGDATFDDNSNNYGTVTGNATFNDSSYNNGGTVTGNATFNDNSSNRPFIDHFGDGGGNRVGTITGDATFNNNSMNMSVVNGDATFNDCSVNEGVVLGVLTDNRNCPSSSSSESSSSSSESSSSSSESSSSSSESSSSSSGACAIIWTDDSDDMDGVTVSLNPSFAKSTFVEALCYDNLLCHDKPPLDLNYRQTSNAISTQTITFSAPVTDPVLALFTFGNTIGVTSTCQSSVPCEIYCNSVSGAGCSLSGQSNSITIDGNTISGFEGYGIVKFPGTHSSITLTWSNIEAFSFCRWGRLVCESFIDCLCWSCGSEDCRPALVGCPSVDDPCIAAGNCCSYIGLYDSKELCEDNCVKSSSSSSEQSSSSSSEQSSSSSSSEQSSSSCSECEDCVQACAKESSWDLENCVPVNVDLSKIFFIDDGNLPESCPPTGPGIIYVPKELTLKVTSGCLETIETKYKWLSNWNRWGRIWNGTGAEEFQPIYDADPDFEYLIPFSPTTPTSMHSILVQSYELQPNDNWDSTLIGLARIVGTLPIHVRYRREYGDYVFVKAEGTSFTRKNCVGCDCDEVPARTPFSGSGPVSPNSNLFNSWTTSSTEEAQIWGCSGVPEVMNTLRVEVTGENTCRPPLPCIVGQCKNIIEDLNSLDQIPGPCDKCYCDGGGRPLDIDIQCGTGKVRPKSEDFPDVETFTLWFRPYGTGAVPVINNVIYDTTQLDVENDIVKIYQASSPEDLRSWVCLNLRFVTVLDYEKLRTDTANAVSSNWPYNDLYWNRSFVSNPSCEGYPYPGDVPVDLVPC